MGRTDGREVDELREISFTRDFTTMADGSVLVTFGNTSVLCTASVDEDVPLDEGNRDWMGNCRVFNVASGHLLNA